MDAPGNGAPAAPPRAAAARGAPDGCQLAELSEVATPLALEDHLRQRFLCLPTAARYCGRELTVKRKVRTIFDERHGRMVRLRRTYLLEGAICDSRGLGDREGCDRCCYYFWRRIWLERVE
jgi:hypothetical protein